MSAEFSELIGCTLKSVEGLEAGGESVEFVPTMGTPWVMDHSQGCCETVQIVEVSGDVEDLIGSPICFAEVSVSKDEDPKPSEYSESWTWTFYTLRTQKGTVSFRWLGESNGYYGEEVDFYLKGSSRW